MGMKLSELGEFGLIKRISREPQREGVVAGIGDDAAVIKDGEEFILYTTDIIVEDSHFRKEWCPPEKIGRKAMVSNISDIAAMGGIPEYALVSIALRSDTEAEFVGSVYKGMYDVADRYGVDIIGGDTTHGSLMVINVVVTGRTDKEHLTLRSGAKTGDYILVSGPLGGSKAGLELLKMGYREPKGPIEKHLDPGCRMDIARDVAVFASAMIDVSDGLASEVRHICEESGVGAIIERERIPLDRETIKAGKILEMDPYDFALHGGEDYELVFTVPEENLDRVRRYGTVVGRIMDKDMGVMIENGEIMDLKGGYEHFREDRR